MKMMMVVGACWQAIEYRGRVESPASRLLRLASE
jgi:hypothetical protein